MSYGTVAGMRQKLPQAPTGETEDAKLQACLDAAHSIIDQELGFSYAEYGATATDRDLQGEGGVWLWLPAYEAGSITGITLVSARGAEGETETEVEAYVADEEARPYRIWRANGWARGAWYRVTAIWGYGTVPDSIVEVEEELAVNLWRARDAGMFTDVVGVDGSGAVAYQRALTNLQRMVIDGARRAALGPVIA